MTSLDTTEAPVAHTGLGELAGRHRRGVQLFGGIPYAAAPVGDRRFAPPAPPEPWEGVRDARRFSPAAPQLPGEGMTDRLPVRWDEDCLYLNVITPACDDARRPVYLWIHGGAYQHGQGAVPWYDGTSFATRGDIVVVTINYRLGALGFCDLGSHLGDAFASSGVNGTLDQVAALRWVRDHIAEFGGDPDRVTIGGESAGAFSVSNLLVSPLADGLFHQGIAQSGATHHVHDPEAGAQVAEEFLAELGRPDAGELRDLDALTILEAQQAVIEARGYEARGIQPFYPTWGHEALPGPPIDLAADGRGAEIPLLPGTNEDEMSLWGLATLGAAGLRRYVGGIVDDSDPFIDAYRPRVGDDPGWLACAVSTDWVFRIPAVRHAEARHANGGTTWMYQFSWDSRAFEGRFGAAHALEIPFTFNTLDRAGVDAFIGDGEVPHGLGEVVHDAWIAFIRDGDPSTSALGHWPSYEPDRRAVMDLDEECGLVDDPAAGERLLWDGIR